MLEKKYSIFGISLFLYFKKLYGFAYLRIKPLLKSRYFSALINNYLLWLQQGLLTAVLLSQMTELLIASMYLEDKNKKQKGKFCGIFLDYLPDESFDPFESLPITLIIRIVELETI